MQEARIIDLFLPAGDGSNRRDPGALDDCAQVDEQTIITTDALVEGTHFRRDWSGPEDLAIKLWAVNCSDIAASGGEPDWCVLNLGVSADTSDEWLERFAQTLRAEITRDGGELVGGDSFRAPQIYLSLTLAGRLVNQRRMTRSAARAGDLIFLTGHTGLSQLGYQLLTDGEQKMAQTTTLFPFAMDSALLAAALERHRRPRARLEWSRQLREDTGVHAMLDVSDGLYADLGRLAGANPDLQFTLDCAALPAPVNFTTNNKTAETESRYLELLLNSGEELELLFTASDDFVPPGDWCTPIGRVSAAESQRRVILENAPWPEPPAGFQHFP